MTDNQSQIYAAHLKKAWMIYSALAILLACILVLFVARDTEEMFFYGFITIAAAYVLRPNEAFFSRKILKYTGVAKPEEKEQP